MGLVRVTNRNREQFIDQIVQMESAAEYPLGADHFKIDHGADYFQFFKRLGDVYYYIWTEGETVAAVAAAVLRSVPSAKGAIKTWYLADLKVHPDFRGQKIPLRMMSRAFFSNYLRCRRGYAVSMNTPGQEHNRIARLLSHFRWAPMNNVARLNIWSLDAEQMQRARPVIEKHRGAIGFRSLEGIKDIILRSTGHPMPLIHVQFGPLADRGSRREVTPGAVHMFCSPEGDSLYQEIMALGYPPSSSASVIAHRMRSCDWTWVLTSDI